MPPLSADQLVKALHLYLSEKLSSSQLAALGWFAFRNFDRPETANPREIAVAAFRYLCVDEEGHWNGVNGALFGIIAFTQRYCGLQIDVTWMCDLQQLLVQEPLDLQAIEGWFSSVCSS